MIPALLPILGVAARTSSFILPTVARLGTTIAKTLGSSALLSGAVGFFGGRMTAGVGAPKAGLIDEITGGGLTGVLLKLLLPVAVVFVIYRLIMSRYGRRASW